MKTCKILICFIYIMVNSLLVSCGISESAGKGQFDDFGYFIKKDNYIYFYDLSSYKEAHLYRYDIHSKNNLKIDTITYDINGYILTPIYCIENSIYYGKIDSLAEDNLSLTIYRFNADANTTSVMGIIPDVPYGFQVENDITGFKIFKNDSLYVLCNKKLYKIDKDGTTIVSEKISSIYIKENNAYFSESINPIFTEGICTYDIAEKKQKLFYLKILF